MATARKTSPPTARSSGKLRKDDETMAYRDYFSEFKRYRDEQIALHEAEARETLCRGSRYTRAKREAILKEIDRLKNGFMESSESVRKRIASEMKVPKWQKSVNWVDSSNANHCYQCKVPLKFMNKKINCRIGGEVFCRECANNEVMIYLEKKQDREPKWMLNGKKAVGRNVGTKPAHFDLYQICSSCAGDLETILKEEEWCILRQRENGGTTLEESLDEYDKVSKCQRKIDRWLPEYQRVVYALDLDSAANINSMDDSRKKKLARLHLNISEAMCVANQSCKHTFDLSRVSRDPEQVDHKVMESFDKRFQSRACLLYEKHCHQFTSACEQLSKHLSSEKNFLVSVQNVSSREIMERVYIDISRLKDNLLKCVDEYNLSFLMESLVEILRSIKEEFMPFLGDGESFEQHFQMAMANQTSQLKVDGKVSNQDEKRMIVISQCSTIVHGCRSRLEEEALDCEFQQTKTLLNETCKKLESANMEYYKPT